MTENNQNIINFYWNGNKIVATDTFTTSSPAIAFTDKIAMISQKNKLSFDYIYGMDIDSTTYGNNTIFNIYSGQYSGMLLNLSFGNAVFNSDLQITGSLIVTNGINGTINADNGVISSSQQITDLGFISESVIPSYISSGLTAPGTAVVANNTNVDVNIEGLTVKIDSVFEKGFDDLIKASYKLLNLETFFTTGEDESRAWTIKVGSTAPEAGRAIHNDFKDKFIRAEEREACARVCEERTGYWQRDSDRADEDEICALAIRARGEK